MIHRFAALLVLLLAACAHSPDPAFFALSVQPGAARQSPPLRVELRRPGLPAYLDRPHIVRRSTPERLDLGGDERWAAPLDEMVSTTLAEDLSQRLPGSVVFSDFGVISVPAEVRIEVQLFRFERMADGRTVLVADVAVQTNGGGTGSVQRFLLSERPKSTSTADIVTSLSHLIGLLADGIAPLVLRGTTKPSP